MKYLIVRWKPQTLEWVVETWAHASWGHGIRAYMKRYLEPKYGEENLCLMVEQNHALADYYRRMNEAEVKPVAPKTSQGMGGSF